MNLFILLFFAHARILGQISGHFPGFGFKLLRQKGGGVQVNRAKALLRTALYIAGISGLMLLVGFSTLQGVTLATALVFVYWAAVDKVRAGTLSPFSVTIHPQWYPLLKDNGLIDEEGWKAFGAQLATAAGTKDYNVLQHGVSFTVLPPVAKGYSAKGWAPGLIYSNNHHIFVSRSNLFEGFREPIPEFGAPWTHLDTANGEKMPLLHTPIFYVRLREVRTNEVGLEIGMTTPESFKKSSEYRPDSDLVPVATLPSEVFEYYYRPDDFDYSRSGGVQRFHQHQERLKSRLAESGWTQQIEGGLCYQHKYADVYIREIT